jgi:hypothetical protein
MKDRTILLIAVAMCVYCLPLWAEEIPVQGRIESVSMFKNGLAVVRHVVSVDKPGDYIVENLSSDPVHGTFWVESDATVKVRASYQEVASDQLGLEGLNLQEGFAGQEVEISFKEPGQATLKGTVERLAPGNHWDQNFNPRPYYDYAYYRSNAYPQAVPYSGLSLAVRTPDGLDLIDPSTIAYLKVLSAKTMVKTRKPVLILQVADVAKAGTKVGITYLTKGLSWAPSYRIDLLDAAGLSIEQSAVIKNEYADINDVEMKLITGFPQVKFAHVTSPLSLKTTLSQFFAQLNQPPVVATGMMANAMVQQQAMINVNDSMPVSGLDLGPSSQGEGVDLYYRSIGKNTLKEGEALFMSLSKAKADYQRIVEWVVPDTRSAEGRPIQDYERQQNPDKFQEAAWDAITFKNPFDFPMTTATVGIYSQGQFNGQSQSNWVNPGEKNVIYVTKALSIKTAFSEQEQPVERTTVNIAGHQHQKVTVTGSLTARNNRAQAVSMLIRRQFSGDLVSATDSPESKLREEGIDSVNKRNELKWELTLQPGEEKKITYSYTVLIPY